MSKIRILHITPWFPNPENSIEAIFIAKHIVALNAHCSNEILHVSFRKNKAEEVQDTYEGISLQRKIFKLLIDKWLIKEKLASNYIRKHLKKQHKEYDIVNFYIAYPNAINIGQLKIEFPQLKFVICEQWSAYHEDFNLPKGHKGRTRIENIFKNEVPLFTVSKALAIDIQQFAALPSVDFRLIPNSVNTREFRYSPKEKREEFIFCSINNWSTLKNPLVLIEAFGLLRKEHKDIRLILGGSGQLDDLIQSKIQELELSTAIDFIGRMPKDEVIQQLKKVNVYCQSSNYETFSAICIESLACGTPVIATNIGGMKDFVTEKNGILVNKMTPQSWMEAMQKSMENYSRYDHQKISEDISKKYNQEAIGELIYDHFKEVLREG